MIWLLERKEDLDSQEARLKARIDKELRGDCGYTAIEALPGNGQSLAAVLVAEIGEEHGFTDNAHLCSWEGMTKKQRE